MKTLSRRAALTGAGRTAAAIVAMGGQAFAVPTAFDPMLVDLLASLKAAKAAEAEAVIPFNKAEEKRFAVARELDHAAGDAEWERIGGPQLEAVKDAAEDAVMAIEDSIRDYEPKSLAELAAKVRTMREPFLEEEGEALARDILALAGEG